MLGTLSAPSGLLLSQVFPGTVVSPSPAAPLCWAFCLPPREPVGPAEFCAQGLGRSFQNQCFFWLWSPAGSQAIDRVVFALQLVADPLLWVCAWGSQPLIQLHAHPGAFCLCSQLAGRLSGCLPTRGFRCGPQATDWGRHPLGHFVSGAQAAGSLIRARAHPGFPVWASRLESTRLQVSARAAFLCSQSRAEGGGAPKAVSAEAPEETSLTSN